MPRLRRHELILEREYAPMMDVQEDLARYHTLAEQLHNEEIPTLDGQELPISVSTVLWRLKNILISKTRA